MIDKERVWWIVALVAMNALYAYGAFGNRLDLFGISALAGLGPARYSIFLALALAAAALLAAVDPRATLDRPAFAIVAASAAGAIFFLLRSNVLNQDGNMLSPKFAADIPRVGAHVTHDELLELFVHSRLWYYTNRWWGWSVVFSYRVASCLAGSAFIYGILRLARRLAPQRSWLFLAGVLSGGYMQLFFGDAENYTITASLVVFYVLAACRFLAGEAPLWLPSIALAIAACFHLEAGWLLPTWLYLAAVSKKRRSDIREATRSAAAGAVMVLATFVYFHFNGLPLWRFASSHAGHALRMNGVFAVGVGGRYYLEQLNLLLLLCPAAVMLFTIAMWHRRQRDELGRFLVIAALSMLIFQGVWKSQLGVYDDWNLYAIGGLLVSVFVWKEVAEAAVSRGMRIAAAMMAATGALHSYAWILANHTR